MNPYADRSQAILEERARELAQPAGETQKPPSDEWLEFALAGERYAFRTKWVREVTVLADFAPIPSTPSFILGMMNLRGQIITLVNLAKLFHSDRDALTLGVVVVLAHGEHDVGIPADRIIGIRTIAESAIIPGSTQNEDRDALLSGITHGDLMLLDASKLLSLPQLAINEVP